jgi:hydroxyacylglutathione hydrolase
MFFKQFYLGCLSHASYMLGSDGEAAVIDPQRDVDIYLAEAQAAGLTIRYVIETHLHADFVSGHAELAKRTGATVVISSLANALFSHRAVEDGDMLTIGSLEIRVLATPGHTPESICLLVSDRSNQEAPLKLFTGDTLFVGDAGRPDLSGGGGHSSAEMAAHLYDSLHQKILQLPDATEVYPAHGAGSLCGRNMSPETWSTLGRQRTENYALRPMSKAEFVEMMTTGLPESPAYFSRDVALNREGAPEIDASPPVPMLSAIDMKAAADRGELILDVRPSEMYGPAHVPGSMNIGLDGQFAPWAGSLLDFARPLVLITQNREQISEAVTRLARIGFSRVSGALDGGFAAWQDAGLPVSSIPQLVPADVSHRMQHEPHPQILDVRRPAETQTGVIRGAITIPLAELKERLEQLDPNRETMVVCGSGYRSSIAASILERAGFRNLLNLDGGMRLYNEQGLPTVVPASA